MIIIKLDYFTLLSQSPFKCGICSIKSPLLREIDKITIRTYHQFLNCLLLDIDSYYEMISNKKQDYFKFHSRKEKEIILKIKAEYDKLSEDEKMKVSIMDILSFDLKIIATIEKALNFFLVETVKYSIKDENFILFDGSVDKKGKLIPSGYISKLNYPEIIDLILQRNSIIKDIKNEDASRVKNKIALRILEKLKKGQSQLDKAKKNDKKMELGNIISSVAAKNNNGLNILNIWDITIYQLYDQFKRTQINASYDINSTNVAVWGDKKNEFNSTLWFENIYYQ